MAIMSHDEFVQKYGRLPTTIPMSGVSSAPAQSSASTSFLDKAGNAAQRVANFVGAKGITQEFGADLASLLAPKSQQKYIEHPTLKTVVGSAIQSGANLVPGLGEGGLLAKTAAGLGAGYGMDVGSKLQNNSDNALAPGVGTMVGGALPVAGAVARPAAALVGRLFKGLGSELSGVSAKTIDQILTNPKAARKAAQLINKSGQSDLLENNAKTIAHGIAGLKQEARGAFGKALEGLKETDINPQKFREAIQPVLDKFGSTVSNGERTLQNVEFTDPKNLAKASDLIDRLSNTKMDGVSLRKLADDIESAKFKTATSDERLSFNAFLKDLSAGVKNAINNSTDKLSEANAAFSHDMQLAQMAEGEFGKVKYKNLPEIVNASKKIENIFQKEGIAPEKINDFLTRIGVDPSEFNAKEAVRQIRKQEGGKNSVGLSVSEMLRGITSAVITPQTVGNIATATGLAREVVEPFLKGLSPLARNAVIQALLSTPQDTQSQEGQ